MSEKYPSPFISEPQPISEDSMSQHIKAIPEAPDKLIKERKISTSERSPLTVENFKKSRRLFAELEDFGIAVAKTDFVVGAGKGDQPAMFLVMDRVEGVGLTDILDEGEATPEQTRAINELYTNLINYYRRKFEEGGEYLYDIPKNRQYIFGKTKDNPEEKLYLIDTDPLIQNLDKNRPTWRANHDFFYALGDLNQSLFTAEANLGISLTSVREHFLDFLKIIPKTETGYEQVEILIRIQEGLLK